MFRLAIESIRWVTENLGSWVPTIFFFFIISFVSPVKKAYINLKESLKEILTPSGAFIALLLVGAYIFIMKYFGYL